MIKFMLNDFRALVPKAADYDMLTVTALDLVIKELQSKIYSLQSEMQSDLVQEASGFIGGETVTIDGEVGNWEVLFAPSVDVIVCKKGQERLRAKATMVHKT
jgi:hypothetical protein